MAQPVGSRAGFWLPSSASTYTQFRVFSVGGSPGPLDWGSLLHFEHPPATLQAAGGVGQRMEIFGVGRGRGLVKV